jgi:Alg9-like mannosyltransferase family
MALTGSAVLMAVALLIALTGGFRTEIAHVRVSAQWPIVSSVGAWLLLVVDYWRRSSDRTRGLRPFAVAAIAAERRGTAVALGLVALTIAAGVAFGARAAAGADPYGYVSQGMLWASGNPVQFQTSLAFAAPWPDAERAFCPLGYRPGDISGIVVPTYAAGLPLQMAALARPFGPTGVWLAVPLLGGLLVSATYRLGVGVCRHKLCALLAAILVACSPVFLFQLMQPMSDVPTSAWWMLALVAALEGTPVGALGSGFAASLGILTRPNLALLLLPVCAYAYGAEPLPSRRGFVRVALFLAAAVPGVALAAAINTVLYGSAIVSGYGTLSGIYDLTYAKDNLMRYPAWLYSSHSLFVFLGLCSIPAAAFLTSLDREQRHHLRRQGFLGLGFAGTVLLSYLFYQPFDHWTFLRFVLPAIPVLIVLALSTVDAIAKTASLTARSLVLTLVACTLPAYYLSFAVHGEALALKGGYRELYVDAADRVRTATPASAAIVGLLQTGSLRFYANRLTLRYDLIPQDGLGRALTFLDRSGHPAYVALHAEETAGFAARFGVDADAVLRQAPSLRMDTRGTVTLYGPLGSR